MKEHISLNYLKLHFLSTSLIKPILKIHVYMSEDGVNFLHNQDIYIHNILL